VEDAHDVVVTRTQMEAGVNTAPGTLSTWLDAVGRIARAVNEAQSLDSILTTVAERACALIGFDYCAVMLADADGERVTLAGYHGLSRDYITMVSDEGALAVHPLDRSLDSPAGRALRDQVTVTVSDTAAALDYGRLSTLAPTQGYRSLLATPLRNSQDCMGILVGYLAEPHEFDALHVELAELLADQTAIAIRTAELRASQQETIAELRQHRAVRDWADQQHRRLMNLLLDDIGLDGLVDALADILAGSVLVEDDKGVILARSSERDFRVGPEDGVSLSPLEAPTSYEVVSVASQTPVWVAPVMVGTELAGRLWVSTAHGDLGPGQRTLVERFSVVAALEVVKRRHVLEVEERLSGDLLDDLLRPEGIAHPRPLLDRAAALGHDLSKPHWLALLTFHDQRPVTSATQRMVGEAARVVMALSGRHENNVVLLIPHTSDPLRALARVHAAVARDSAPVKVSALLSSNVDEIGDYARVYALAEGAARLRRMSGAGALIDLRSLGVTSLLLISGTVDRSLRDFAVDLLEPVRSHDERRRTDLLVTLRAWLDCGFSTAATATRLTVHVNTVSYRIARIQELLGRDLGRPDTRLELQLACDVAEVLALETE
jgi:sugar diacid utilization regulator/GAF domain-containing protein